MVNIIISLGITAYSLFLIAIIFAILRLVKRKVIYFKLHRAFAITAISLVTIHGTIAFLFFKGFI